MYCLKWQDETRSDAHIGLPGGRRGRGRGILRLRRLGLHDVADDKHKSDDQRGDSRRAQQLLGSFGMRLPSKSVVTAVTSSRRVPVRCRRRVVTKGTRHPGITPTVCSDRLRTRQFATQKYASGARLSIGRQDAPGPIRFLGAEWFEYSELFVARPTLPKLKSLFDRARHATQDRRQSFHKKAYHK